MKKEWFTLDELLAENLPGLPKTRRGLKKYLDAKIKIERKNNPEKRVVTYPLSVPSESNDNEGMREP